MKFQVTTLFLLSVLSMPITAHATLQEVIQVPEHVFIPDGFDSNDHVEVVLHGSFPSNCYHAGPATATTSGNQVMIKNIAYLEPEATCFNMAVPWTTTASIGILKAGKYIVTVQNSNTSSIKFGNIPVATALTKNIDDYLYAYVNAVLVKQNENRIPTVTLTGSFSMDCMYIKDVKIAQSKPDVISILPIVDFIPNKPCAHMFAPIPFEKTITLDFPLTEKATLFHVRSMNGQAINQVLE